MNFFNKFSKFMGVQLLRLLQKDYLSFVGIPWWNYTCFLHLGISVKPPIKIPVFQNFIICLKLLFSQGGLTRRHDLVFLSLFAILFIHFQKYFFMDIFVHFLNNIIYKNFITLSHDLFFDNILLFYPLKGRHSLSIFQL